MATYDELEVARVLIGAVRLDNYDGTKLRLVDEAALNAVADYLEEVGPLPIGDDDGRDLSPVARKIAAWQYNGEPIQSIPQDGVAYPRPDRVNVEWNLFDDDDEDDGWLSVNIFLRGRCLTPQNASWSELRDRLTVTNEQDCLFDLAGGVSTHSLIRGNLVWDHLLTIALPGLYTDNTAQMLPDKYGHTADALRILKWYAMCALTGWHPHRLMFAGAGLHNERAKSCWASATCTELSITTSFDGVHMSEAELDAAWEQVRAARPDLTEKDKFNVAALEAIRAVVLANREKAGAA